MAPVVRDGRRSMVVAQTMTRRRPDMKTRRDKDRKDLVNIRRRVNRARHFLENTCPASRHLHVMAESLATGQRYAMFEEEPEHCALTMLSVLESLWKMRTQTGWPN